MLKQHRDYGLRGTTSSRNSSGMFVGSSLAKRARKSQSIDDPHSVATSG
jgi:hypothetical protein